LSGTYWVYMARTKDNALYTGVSVDPDRRIRDHNAGRGAKALRGKAPITLQWLSDPKDHSGALKLEAAIKRLTPAEKWKIVGGGLPSDVQDG